MGELLFLINSSSAGGQITFEYAREIMICHRYRLLVKKIAYLITLDFRLIFPCSEFRPAPISFPYPLRGIPEGGCYSVSDMTVNVKSLIQIDVHTCYDFNDELVFHKREFWGGTQLTSKGMIIWMGYDDLQDEIQGDPEWLSGWRRHCVT